MRFVADLHVHSRYSRACSRDCDLEHLAWWAARKGISVVGTGDLTHPQWSTEIREKLVPAEPGLFRLRSELERDVLRTLPPATRTATRFLLSVEISTIYKRADRTRKVHHLLYAPDLDAAAELTRRLARIGNLSADGRPILGLDSRDLLETTLDSGDGCYLVPAHVWTPWFAALGSKSGFDSVADCYADLAEHVFAVETGLSSDPAMNWRVSGLDRYRLVSNSDAHSPPALGREATVFDTELSYWDIRQALATGAGFAGTIEFFPEEGKYHLDGHRKCEVRLEPAETRQLQGRCPSCDKPLTIGVLHRVAELADRPEGARPAGAAPFRCLVSLPQLVGEIHGVGPKSKAVTAGVDRLVARLGPELAILQDVPLDDIAAEGSAALGEAVGRLRRGEVIREAGYDGEYGVIRVFDPKELADLGQGSLFGLDVPTPPPPSMPARPSAVPAAGPTVVPMPRQPAQSPVLSPVLSPAQLSAQLSGLPPESATGTDPLAGLDPEQRAAATVVDGPLLILAGPGTGKTRTLTHRIAHLITGQGAAPEHCLAITFTRRAAAELAERLADLVPDAAGRILVTTFHGLGLRIVTEQADRLSLGTGFRIADDAERLALIREAFGRAGAGIDGRRLLTEVSRVARGGAVSDPEQAGAMARYRAGKRSRNLVDLDDLITLPVALLAGNPDLVEQYRARWRWISIDEYQDVDEMQYRLLSLLSPPDGRLCAIGDPDQAIYRFRGSDVGFFLRFSTDFPTARVISLSRNYRSTPVILRAAVHGIAPTSLVPGRRLIPAADVAGPDRVVLRAAADERAEAAFVVDRIERLLGGSSFHSLDSGRVEPWQDAWQDRAHSFADVAVLYRTDAQARALADALDAEGIPYQKRSHHRLADQPGVREVLAALRADAAIGNGSARPVLTRLRAAAAAACGAAAALADVPGDDPDGLDPEARVEQVRAAVELLTPLAERSGVNLGQFLAEIPLGAEVDLLDPRADRVSLLTLHAAKGLEFPVVFVTGCEDGLLPFRFPGEAGPDADAELAEERRLFFVGLTRARAALVLTWARRRAVRGQIRDNAPSRFLADLDAALLDRTLAPARRSNVQLRLL